MDNEDREASPEPSSSQLCENSIDDIDGYLSGEGPSSAVIDSSHLFSNAFDEDEDYVENHSKSPGNSSEYKLIPFDRSYNYNEAAIACQVDQSHFCDRSNIYSSPSNSKQNDNDFNPMEIDDNQPGSSSSGSFSTPSSEQQNFQTGRLNCGFEPTSNRNENGEHYKLSYPLMNFGQVSEANSVNSNASSSKQADSSLFGKNKGFGKNKSSKGKGKGKMSSKHSFPGKFKPFKPRENRVESSNKHSLFAIHSPQPANPLVEIEHIANQSDIDNENNEIENPVHTSSPYQRDIQNHNEDDEAYMVASSSEGMNAMDQILELKSPTTPGDSCMVSSSTGQLDSLPPTPINFQGNDASHSSPASSPLNPPVLDSTVDSTSGQNLLSSPYSDGHNEIVQSNDDIEFACSLDEGRNEISTSVSHLQHGVDSQDLNLLVGTTNDGAHFVSPFISLNNLESSSLHSTLADEKSNDETVSALIPTSSAYLPDSLEIPGSSHMSDASKRLLYERRKDEAYRSSLGPDNSSLRQSSTPLNNIDSLSFNDENALASCNSEGALSHVGLIELGISEMEPESSTLVASSANLDNEEFPASSGSALSPSQNNFQSSSTLAQLNQHYLLGIGESSLSSEDGLSPESVSQPGPELHERSLGLTGQLRETEESLESASDSEEGASNFQASLELGLGPQQLRGLIGSRQEPQSLVPPPHLLEEAHNTESAANMDALECSVSLSNNIQSANSGTNNFHKPNEQILAADKSESSADEENSFIIMVSETQSPPAHFSSFGSRFNKSKEMNIVKNMREKRSDFDGNYKIGSCKRTGSIVSELNNGSNHSSDFHPHTSQKENIYRIPNGFIDSSDDEDNGKNRHPSKDNNNYLPRSATQKDKCSESSNGKRNSIPINIHSLFSHRPSILKPSSSKHFSSFPSDSVSRSTENGRNDRPDGHRNESRAMSNGSMEISERIGEVGPSSLDEHNHQNHFVKQEQFMSGMEGNSHDESFMNNVEMENASMMEENDDENTHHSDSTSREESSRRDNGFWCADCEEILEAKCSLHRIQTIMDKPVLTRAWASLPAQHLTIKHVVSEAGSCNGVFTRKVIPKRTQFGPLEGRFTSEMPPSYGLSFKSTQNGSVGFIDISEEGSSNWMRFVRAASAFYDMNCVVIEEENFIYFLTTTNLSAKTELRVGYSKQYAVKYNLPLLVPSEEEERDLQKKSLCCGACSVVFTSVSDLQSHASSHNKVPSEDRRSRRKARPKSFKQVSPQPSRFVKRVKVNKRVSVSGITDENVILMTKKGREVLECGTCDLCFQMSELLQIHSLSHNFPQFEDDLTSEEEASMKALTDLRECPLCSTTFDCLEEVIEHVQEHSFLAPKHSEEQRSFKCELCYKSFCSKERLRGHAESHKSDTEKPFACYHCFRRFCNKSALGSHLKLHVESEGVKVYDCPICQEKFYTVASLKSHLPSHSVEGEYTCPTCSKKFPSYHKIRRHIRSYHSAIHPCEECGKTLPSLEKLKVHLVSHSDRRDFACPVCLKCFKRKDKMKEHLKRIHTIKREPNNNNNNSNNNNNDSNAHSNYSSKKKNNPKFVPKVDPSDYKQFMYKCDLCLLGFKRRGMLVNHLSKRHPDISLSSIPELNEPILRTSHSYFCQYCGKAYVSTTKRKLHILKNHPGSELPPSRCPMGDEGTKTTRTYAASCPWCPRQYATKAKLLQHQRHHHGRGKGGVPPTEPKRELEEEEEVGEEEEELPQEDILSQAFGRISGKAQFVRMDASGGEQGALGGHKGEHSGGPLGGDQVLVSPSLLLPHEGAAYALLTPDGADAFTLSLRPGQIIPSVGGFSVISEGPSSQEEEESPANPGPSSRLRTLEGPGGASHHHHHHHHHSQFALDLNGVKGGECVVTQVGGGSEAPSPVLVWQPSLSFASSS